MLKYAIKRLLLIIPTMLLVTFMVFVLVNLTPSDPGRIKLGADAPQEAVDQINHELGVDQPVPVQYVKWVLGLFRGDLGKSYFTNKEVFSELMVRFPNTLRLTLGYGAGYLRYTRTAMLDTIRQDYIRTARAKGCKESAVIWKHAFRNSMMTVVTITGMSFAGLLGGAIVSENVFSISGVGMMGITAIQRRDMPQILASLITIGTLFMIIMVIVDLMYAVLNPRIRALMNGGKKLKNWAKVRESMERTPEEIAAMADPVLPEGYTDLFNTEREETRL